MQPIGLESPCVSGDALRSAVCYLSTCRLAPRAFYRAPGLDMTCTCLRPTRVLAKHQPFSGARYVRLLLIAAAVLRLSPRDTQYVYLQLVGRDNLASHFVQPSAYQVSSRSKAAPPA